MGRKETLLNALEFMDEMDRNGSWHEVVNDIKDGKEVAAEEISYTIETMQQWKSEMDQRTDNKMINRIEYHIKRLNALDVI